MRLRTAPAPESTNRSWGRIAGLPLSTVKVSESLGSGSPTLTATSVMPSMDRNSKPPGAEIVGGSLSDWTPMKYSNGSVTAPSVASTSTRFRPALRFPGRPTRVPSVAEVAVHFNQAGITMGFRVTVWPIPPGLTAMVAWYSWPSIASTGGVVRNVSACQSTST